MMKPGISVVICSYNGAERLPETLRHLALQLVPSNISWEIIIVNNASTDDTALVALSEWRKYDLFQIPFTVLEEPKKGKNYAIKIGASRAQFAYLLVCDDDNWLSQDYIANANSIMASDGSIGVLGGCGIFHPEQPAWKDLETHKASYVNGPQPWADSEHWVYGAGCLFRNDVFNRFYNAGWQQIAYGKTRRNHVCGEDVEICFMFYLCGYKIISDDRLRFRHFVPLYRQNLEYIRKLHYWQSYSYVLLRGYIMLLRDEENDIRDMLKLQLINTIKAALVQNVRFRFTRWLKARRLTFQQITHLTAYSGAIYSILKNGKKIIAHYKSLQTIQSNLTHATERNGLPANQ